MVNQRIHKFSSCNPPCQARSSLFVPRPFTVQAQQDSHHPPTPEEIENETFDQHKFEAFGLQTKQESGTITPVEQERLDVLQAKMNDFWAQRLERASQFDHNFANILVHAPERQGATPVQPQFAIQAKLTIGQPNDRYEQEADRVAAQVVNQINTPQSSQQGETLQRQVVHEENEEEDEKLQMKPALQASAPGIPATPELEFEIGRSRYSGHPLAASIRKPMEQAFGTDFSQVKAHTDTRADQLNRSIQAKAFTTGQDIFFRQGAYSPESHSGQQLIAHELTHVMQQSGTRFTFPTSNMSGTLLQAKLMDVDTFTRLKHEATRKTKFLKRQRSSKDYKKYYDQYQTALQTHNIDQARTTLQKIDSKIDRMADKTYWQNDEKRNQLLQQLKQGVSEERLIIDKLSIEKNVGKEFDESGSFKPARPELQYLSNQDKDYLLAQQRHDMVIEVLKTIREQVPEARDDIMNPALIKELDKKLSTPTTYVDVYNKVVEYIISLASTTQDKLIQKINRDHASNPQKRVIEIAKVLWGNFTWQTDSNDFRDWAEGRTNNSRDTTATMNCWEAVLEILMHAGVVDPQKVQSIYQKRSIPEGKSAYYESLRDLLGWTQSQDHLAYKNGDYTGKLPPSGSVIFYESSRPPDNEGNTLEHVVLSLGQNSRGETEVMSLWSQVTGGKLGKTTMDALMTSSNIQYISFS